MRLPLASAALALALALVGSVALLSGAPAAPAAARPDARACPGSARVSGFSDALDKLTRHGATLGGLSDIAWDARSRSWASTVDNHLSDPARIWFYRDLADPRVVRDPLVLRRPDHTPYTGVDADDEGLAVLADGRYAVSSENEPVIRIFGRGGVQQEQIRVPKRFRVAPAGGAIQNATLEGLTTTAGGRRLVAAMEGPIAADGDADSTYRRLLVFDRVGGDGRYALTRQFGYRVQPGNRIAEVQSYGADRLLVLEAAFSPATGNTVELYAVRGPGSAPRPPRAAHKTLVADVTGCPSLGAAAKQPQANPLLDNIEGLAVTPRRDGRWGVVLISDDNFGATQITRVVRLTARLP